MVSASLFFAYAKSRFSHDMAHIILDRWQSKTEVVKPHSTLLHFCNARMYRHLEIVTAAKGLGLSKMLMNIDKLVSISPRNCVFIANC